MLFLIFIWSRVRVWCKAVLVAYVLLMAVALAYAGEHYFSDVIAGWLAAAAVAAAFSFLERRRKRSKAVDTLDEPPHAPAPTASRMENPCPPIETMPSST
jgi:membrane-associated phospholipid phosphatase